MLRDSYTFTYVVHTLYKLHDSFDIPIVTFKRAARKPSTVTVVALCPPPQKKSLGTRRLGGPQSRSGLFIFLEKKQIYAPIPGFKTQTLEPIAQSLYRLRYLDTRQRESDLIKERLRWTGHVARVGKEQKLDLMCP